MNPAGGTTQHGIGGRGDKPFIYVYARKILGRDHEWVQDALTVTVAMFRRMELDTNRKITKVMVCMPGFIWWKWGELAYK